jgi:prepilin-type N-terminal cleavage/methylation domain-containing protein
MTSGRRTRQRPVAARRGWGRDPDRARPERADGGFTLVELLIVVTIIPLIIGALSLGIISVFKLQPSVSNRLSDTADAQVVQASYRNDVQGAATVTTNGDGTVTPYCTAPSVSGTRLLGLGSNYVNNPNGFTGYLTDVSYVKVYDAGNQAWNLDRIYCTNGNMTSGTVTVLARNLTAGQGVPTLTCVASVSSSVCDGAATQYILTTNVSQVSIQITAPSSNYTYTLAASPIDASSTAPAGSQFTADTTASCNFASPGTGTYATTMCFVDFSSVTGAALLTAEGGGCLEMSVSLPNNYTLYFCLSLSGSQVLPWYLPTWPQAFLGNSIGGAPFYTGIAGDPALYQRNEGGTSIITFSNIEVVSPSGTLATGWEATSADAESTDSGESITWTSDQALTIIPDGEAGQTQPVGNACLNGVTSQGLTGSGTTTVTCSGSAGGHNETGATKTGTAMVYATGPSYIKAVLVGTGLEAVTFGMILP